MDVKLFQLDELKPYEKNPRRNDRAVEAVAKSIEQFGFKVPIVIDADNVIVCGHTRYRAAQKLKLNSVPCIVADDLTPAQIKAFRLADNKVSELATWDIEKLTTELNSLTSELADEFSFDLPTQDESISPVTELTPSSKQKPDYETIKFVFAREQKKIVDEALNAVADQIQETFGNPNKTENALYEVVRQWTELKKSSGKSFRIKSRRRL